MGDTWVEQMRKVMLGDAAEAQADAARERANPAVLSDDTKDRLLAKFGGRAFGTFAANPAEPRGGRVECQPASSRQDGNLASESDLLSVSLVRNTWGAEEDTRAVVAEYAATGIPPQATVHFTKDQWIEFVAFGNELFGL